MSTRWVDREKKLRLIGDRPKVIDTVYVDNAAARRDLGYEPRVSIADGLERLAASFAGGAADAATQPI